MSRSPAASRVQLHAAVLTPWHSGTGEVVDKRNVQDRPRRSFPTECTHASPLFLGAALEALHGR